jgi:hypothetical protein
MPPAAPKTPRDDAAFDVDTLLLIVVGAHPRAEATDRAVAYRLRQAFADALAARHGGEPPLRPLVVTDVWYLNDASLRGCAAVSVGAPGVNAFTAYLGDKLPSAFVVDDRLMVQMDLDLTDLIAACWGVDARATAEAAEAFVSRYLEDFTLAAVRRAGL